MLLACSTLPFRERYLPEALEEMASLGVRHVEFCVDPRHCEPGRWNETPEDTLRKADHLGILVNSIHAPLPHVPPQASLGELREIYTETTRNAIDLAAFFSAGFVVQHVRFLESSMFRQDPTLEEKAVPCLSEVVPYAVPRGIRLALENVPTSAYRMLGANADEMTALVDLFQPDVVGTCLDITHCIASGLDPLQVLDAIDFQRLISIHASDNYKGQLIDQHLPLGAGDLPWDRLLETLNSRGFEGSFVIEVAGGENDGEALRDSLDFLRKYGLVS